MNPLSPAQKLTCTVAVLTAQAAGSVDSDVYHAMVSTISYASLDPPLFCTSVALQSRTGQAILESGKLAVSLLGESQAEYADNLWRLSKSRVESGDLLGAAGFNLSRFAVSKLPYIADCALALDCTMTNKMLLPQSTLIIFAVDQMMESELRPLIRYHRHYAKLAIDLAFAADDYPV